MSSAHLVVAQITDTHLFADPLTAMSGIVTAESLRQVVQQVARVRHPDLLLLTGDLSQDETPASYENLQAIVAGLAPHIGYLPGNHDDPRVLQQVFEAAGLPLRSALSLGGWRFLLLSSVIAQDVRGELSPETLDWLDRELQATPDQPTLIALHHPPFAPFPDWESIILTNPEDLFAVIDRHPQVKLVLSGHVHQGLERERQNVHYLSAPSTCTQFDRLDDGPLTQAPRPGARLLELSPDGTWNSWIERVTL